MRQRLPGGLLPEKPLGPQPHRLHRVQQGRHAVVRNRIRRRLREIYRLHEREIVRGYDLVVVSRVRACAADYHQLETAFLSACAKLGLLTEGDGGA